MQELLEHIARRLVDRHEGVRVTREEREGVIVLRLEVADDDVGKVIGRHGRVARALRTLARASGAKTGERVLVEIGA
jgi:predicted RNA-binding protein YlqC (UPF0109 family)